MFLLFCRTPAKVNPPTKGVNAEEGNIIANEQENINVGRKVAEQYPKTLRYRQIQLFEKDT